MRECGLRHRPKAAEQGEIHVLFCSSWRNGPTLGKQETSQLQNLKWRKSRLPTRDMCADPGSALELMGDIEKTPSALQVPAFLIFQVNVWG